MPVYNLTVNGSAYSLNIADPTTPLLYVLQDNLNLTGPKFGCGLGQCGCCTVTSNGTAIRSCITAMQDLPANATIVSIEGLGTAAAPHPLQQAFIDNQAMQCGFCISGPMMTGKAFLDANPNATSDQILANFAQTPMLCRCHAHSRMMAALVQYQQKAVSK